MISSATIASSITDLGSSASCTANYNEYPASCKLGSREYNFFDFNKERLMKSNSCESNMVTSLKSWDGNLEGATLRDSVFEESPSSENMKSISESGRTAKGSEKKTNRKVVD